MVPIIKMFTLFTIASASATEFTIRTAINGPTLIDEFISFTIDAYYASYWSPLEPLFTSTSASTLAKGLSPAYFRFGGTNEDSVIYSVGSNQQDPSDLLPNNTCYLNLTQFTELVNFAKSNGNKFIFGHMLQYRYDNNTFDPSNSINLFNAVNQAISPQMYLHGSLVMNLMSTLTGGVMITIIN